MLRYLAVVAWLLAGTAAFAQVITFPARPVRIIVSSAAGGASDTIARMVAERLAARWKQSVVVENRTGGAAVIATEMLARATPDGHTLALLGSTLATNPAVRNDLSYNTARDLTPVLYFGAAPAVLTVRADFPARTPAEFFAAVKAAPGKYSYGSPGISTNGHRSTELLKRAMGLQITHVPYKGAVPALTDLIGGQIAMLMATPTAFMQHIKAGRLKTIAVTSAKRFPTMPDVPTFMESGVPDFDHVEWWMFMLPAGVPEAIQVRLHGDLSAVVTQVDFKQRVLDLDIETFGNTREASRAFLQRELARWARDAKALGMTP